MGRIGEAVAAARQHARERAGQKRIDRLARVFQAEQHGGEVAVGPGQKRMAARQRLEAGGHGEGRGACIEAWRGRRPRSPR